MYLYFRMKDLRAGIIRLLQQGKNSEEIGKLLGISPRTARKVITRFKGGKVIAGYRQKFFRRKMIEERKISLILDEN